MSVHEKCTKCLDNSNPEQVFKSLVRIDSDKNYYVPLKINLCDPEDSPVECTSDFTWEQLLKSLLVINDCDQCSLKVSIDSESINLICNECDEMRHIIPIVKQLYIPNKGLARILYQQDSWKLAMYWNENILYLSDNNGITWDYQIVVPFTASLVCLAYIFKNGDVIVGIKGNKIYSSQDLLTTFNEITVLDTDGFPLIFHVPVNPIYPGLYFGVLIPESYMIGATEMLVWGTYWQEQDYVGATPINLYYTIDGGENIKVAYKFGDNPDERDDGTRFSGPTGNIIGDVTNPVYCHHVHYTGFNPTTNIFYFQTGDRGAETGILEGSYNVGLNTWSFTWHGMPDVNDFFRMAGMRFLPGNKVLWTSDSNASGGIYQCDLANIFSINKTNHTAVFLSNASPRKDMIGLSDYGEFMVSCRYSSVPAIIASNDYGQTWKELSDSFFGPPLIPGHWYTVRKPYKTDSDGYILMTNFPNAGQCASYNFLMKLTNQYY